jgi:hypothetical protein
MKINVRLLSVISFSLLFSFLFSKKASAADIKLGSASFTPLIIIPIVILIVSIVLILLLIFKADIAKRINQYQQKRLDGKRYEENPLTAKKIETINIYIQKLQLLLLKQKNMGDMMIWNKFSVIVRKFFKEFLDIEYEFTDSELIQELIKKKQGQKMIDIVKELDVRYAENITRKDIENLERNFEQILYSLNTKEVRKFEKPEKTKKPIKKKRLNFV